MKMLIGLGNPGLDYAKTRHNAGFMVIERLISKQRINDPVKAKFHAACVDTQLGGHKCILMRPTTYMNRSGISVVEAVAFYKLQPAVDIMVIADDIALPTGMIKIKPAGGSGGQNGLSDITRALGSDQYPRLRVGIGMQPAGGKPAVMNQADFVLSRFIAEEQPLLESSIDQAAEALDVFVRKGLDAAMNAFNSKNNPDKDQN
ncbi:MAG: aminoacyl-tRNA hydrolase [Phycisphaerales bacterium]|nr:aminoacyl-tRNA hydrolase [Phycisphaerales bacterium]